jgi:diguanylate cyclase (GGDEF)-like protein
MSVRLLPLGSWYASPRTRRARGGRDTSHSLALSRHAHALSNERLCRAGQPAEHAGHTTTMRGGRPSTRRGGGESAPLHRSFPLGRTGMRVQLGSRWADVWKVTGYLRSVSRPACWRQLCGACTLIVAFIGFLAVHRWLDHRLVLTVDNLAQLMAAVIAAVLSGRAGARAGGPRGRPWWLLSLGATSWALGQLIWIYYEVLRGVDVPFPSPADAGFLGFSVLAVAALLSFPAVLRGRRLPPRALLDGLIVAGALLAISWSTVLGTVLQAGADSGFALVIALAYPIADVVVATAVLLAQSRADGPQRTTLWTFGVGVLALAAADSAFAYLTDRGEYATGGPLDAGWVAGFLLLGVAAANSAVSGGEGNQPAEAPPSLMQTLLPYLPLAAATAVTFAPALNGHRLDLPALVTYAAVLILVLVRQYLVLAENHRLLRTVRQKAFRDELTGLANRAVFLDRLRHAVELHRRDQQTMCVVFLDLDDFKRVNDSLGHEAGDKLLVRAAERLRASVRVGDTIARLGGDEFAILLEGDLDNPQAVLARLRAAFGVPVGIDGRQMAVSASLGIRIATAGETGGADADALLRDADVAMYEAKRRGKGGYTVFEESMHARAVDQFELRADVPAALADDEFELAYQPVYDLRTGLMAGAEALLRWRHPQRGLLTAKKFLSVVEDTGAIVPIGRWAVDAACAALHHWTDMLPLDRHFFVSVNLSGRQLRDEQLVPRVREAMEAHRLAPGQLILEITETTLIADLAAAADVLTRLHALGARIALDDFGTGYSSLSHLDALPVSLVKTDRAFVEQINDFQTVPPLVAAIATLCAALGLTGVAEGIGTKEQYTAARDHGYRLGQGYLLGEPQKAGHITARLHAELEGPVSQQPVSQQPVSQQPVSQQPVSQQPASQQPAPKS